MRIALPLVILFAAATSADEPPSMDAAAVAIKSLEGTWEGYAVEGRGERPDRGPVHLRLTFAGDEISAVDLDGDTRDLGKGKCKIDPSQPIHQLDATGILLPGKRERTFLGIYELDRDTLKWCVDNRQKERPTEFRTAGGKFLLVLKRQKPLAP
jgi:uncharacterized protein (TIGR03067 family)